MSEMRDERPKPKPHWTFRLVLGRRPAWTIVRICLMVGLTLFLFKVVLLPIETRGTSMVPTLRNGSIHFVNKLAYSRNKPHRGDIVAVTLEEHGLVLVKRIVGLPGERVSIHDGGIYIDEDRLNEPYIKERTPGRYNVQLQPRQYFVIGDNRTLSEYRERFDWEILGKVVF